MRQESKKGRFILVEVGHLLHQSKPPTLGVVGIVMPVWRTGLAGQFKLTYSMILAVNTTSSLLPPVIGWATMEIGAPFAAGGLKFVHFESELKIKDNFDITSHPHKLVYCDTRNSTPWESFGSGKPIPEPKTKGGMGGEELKSTSHHPN